MPKHPDFHLTARTDIGKYRKGDHIEDKAAVDAILKSEHVAHFVRVAADPVPKVAAIAAVVAAKVVEQAASKVAAK